MKTFHLAVLLVLALLLLTGCFRKHVMSSPPSQTPSTQAGERTSEGVPPGATPARVEPAPQPEPAPEAIEETYVVDSPAGTTAERVQEDELDEEPLPVDNPEPVVAESESAPVEQPVAEKAESVKDAVAPGGPYYVQVGAFSDEQNASRALARLVERGYEGSRMSETETGLFRVQAGSFPDEATAGKALEALKAEYPKGFVLKTD